MEALYKFYWDCGRGGELEGVFIADVKEMEGAYGNEAYFGEVLGKHSDIYDILKKDAVKEIIRPQSSFDEEILQKLKNLFHGNNISGYNPLDYMRYECKNCYETYRKFDFTDFENKICGYCNEN